MILGRENYIYGLQKTMVSFYGAFSSEVVSIRPKNTYKARKQI
jgi:hypothetical protein